MGPIHLPSCPSGDQSSNPARKGRTRASEETQRPASSRAPHGQPKTASARLGQRDAKQQRRHMDRNEQEQQVQTRQHIPPRKLNPDSVWVTDKDGARLHLAAVFTDLAAASAFGQPLVALPPVVTVSAETSPPVGPGSRGLCPREPGPLAVRRTQGRKAAQIGSVAIGKPSQTSASSALGSRPWPRVSRHGKCRTTGPTAFPDYHSYTRNTGGAAGDKRCPKPACACP